MRSISHAIFFTSIVKIIAKSAVTPQISMSTKLINFPRFTFLKTKDDDDDNEGGNEEIEIMGRRRTKIVLSLKEKD